MCPKCGAQDSLQQAVRIEMGGTRPVVLAGPDGSRKVEYGPVDPDLIDDNITDEEEIECTRCKETWADADDLLDIEPPIEHRCTDCDWWGFNPWQHGIERPDCPGEVKPREEIPA
jgi:hypothetical protein